MQNKLKDFSCYYSPTIIKMSTFDTSATIKSYYCILKLISLHILYNTDFRLNCRK